MRLWLPVLLIVFVTATARETTAQSTLTYRGRLTAETSGSLVNRAGAPASRDDTRWESEQRFVAALDSTWTGGDRARIGMAGVALGSSDGSFDGRLREIYARASATSWLDLEAGKRIVRWGVGYGFSPAGVLDPPRSATDPTDRLQVNDGRLMVRGDLYRRDSALTIAAAERVSAARLTTVISGGVEVGIIAAAGRGRRPSYAGTITHVVGQRLEWHAEALVHTLDGKRKVSAAAGVQYTFDAGVNLVVEYHRNAAGLSDPEWADVRNGRRAPGARPSRRNLLFARAARAGADAVVAPELIVVWGLDDGGWTVVPSVTWSPHRRLQAYLRMTRLGGPRGSLSAASPLKGALTGGVTVRF